MIPYLRNEDLQDLNVWVPVYNHTTERFEYFSRKLSEVPTPLGPGFLDLKRHFGITSIKYRRKWRVQGGATGQYDASVDANEFEVVNVPFLQFLSKDAGAAVSELELPADLQAENRASLATTALPSATLILFYDDTKFQTNWIYQDWDNIDVRVIHNGTGSVNAVLPGIFNGYREGAQSGSHTLDVINDRNQFFLTSSWGDLALETSNPTTYGVLNSNFDVDFGSGVVFYREFWQVVKD